MFMDIEAKQNWVHMSLGSAHLFPANIIVGIRVIHCKVIGTKPKFLDIFHGQ